MQKKDNLILITGALGFIGSGVVRSLNDKGYYNLLLVDDFDKSEKWKNLVSKKFVDLIATDKIFDYLNSSKVKILSIIHLGACSDTTCDDSKYLWENNFRFSQNLFLYALKNNIRFIYASSAATYGDGSFGFCDDETGTQRRQTNRAGV